MTLAELRATGWRFECVHQQIYAKSPGGGMYFVADIELSPEIDSRDCYEIAALLNGDPRITAAIELCRKYATPGSNVGAHQLALQIIAILEGKNA